MDKKDHSIYFHIYRKPGESTMGHEGIGETPITHIYLTKFRPTGFFENKISFHETGVVHSTDKNGKRYRDGLRGNPFSDIKDIRSLLTIAPTNPHNLIEISKPDTSRDIIIHLNDDIEAFLIHFFVYKKEAFRPPHIRPELRMTSGCIQCELDNKQYGIAIDLSKISKAKNVIDMGWPITSIILKSMAT